MNQALALYGPQLPLGSLDAYLARVQQIPLLSAEEESSLATALQERGDLQAAQRLVLSHLRYVARIAKGYLGYGLPLADLIQEGTIGLMKAVKRFDPKQGFRLVSFAVHWIKAEIHEYVLKNWRIVKIATTKAQRTLFYKLKGHKRRLGWFSQEEIESVAQDLGVKPAEVVQMEARLNAQDVAFDAPVGIQAGEPDKTFAPIDYLEAPNADPAMILEHQNWESRSEGRLQVALAQLDARSQDILQERWLRPANQEQPKAKLKALAEKHKVSPERIRQLEQAAIKKLKSWIEADSVESVTV